MGFARASDPITPGAHLNKTPSVLRQFKPMTSCIRPSCACARPFAKDPLAPNYRKRRLLLICFFYDAHYSGENLSPCTSDLSSHCVKAAITSRMLRGYGCASVLHQHHSHNPTENILLGIFAGGDKKPHDRYTLSL